MTELSEARVEWIDRALHSLGRERTGTVVVERERPWALVAHMPTVEGRVWFKANGEPFAYEAAALRLLATECPEAVLEPIAVDDPTGWFLTDDAGPTGEVGGVSVLEVVGRYAEIQGAAASVTSELLRAGVPDRRPARLLAVFDRAVAHPEAGDAGARCGEARAAMVEACDRLDRDLADGGARATIINSDVKPEHVFVGPPLRLYDWGDAVVSHPLAGLPAVERLAAASGLPFDSLLEPWGVERGSDLALAGAAVGELIGADVWMRDMPGVFDRHPGALGRAIARLADRLGSL